VLLAGAINRGEEERILGWSPPSGPRHGRSLVVGYQELGVVGWVSWVPDGAWFVLLWWSLSVCFGGFAGIGVGGL